MYVSMADTVLQVNGSAVDSDLPGQPESGVTDDQRWELPSSPDPGSAPSLRFTPQPSRHPPGSGPAYGPPY